MLFRPFILSVRSTSLSPPFVVSSSFLSGWRARYAGRSLGFVYVHDFSGSGLTNSSTSMSIGHMRMQWCICSKRRNSVNALKMIIVSEFSFPGC